MKVLFLISAWLVVFDSFGQTPLPVSRTSWSATPAGWTDSYGGLTYTSVLACDGNSNRAKLSVTGATTQVFFSGVPNILNFDLQGNGNDAISSVLVEESPDGSTWTTLANISNISGSCVTYSYILTCATTLYVRWTYTKSVGNVALDNVSISVNTTCGGPTCPILTAAILNSCNNPGCNEGDAEIMLFNAGASSINVSSFPTHTIDYFGSTANFTAGTANAYAGTASSNAGITAGLNSSTGCSGSFIDANAVGTIPAGATFIMVPNNFCYSNYDFSNICSAFGPIYVVYFSTVGWNTSGNLGNYQAGSNPKYITADFSWVNGSCSKEYYTYDAGSEYSGGTGGGDGASIAFPQSVSTSSASPTAPNYYSGAGACALPTVLPIDLLQFKADVIDEATSKLNFTTSNETNVKQYIISKSLDAYNYSVIDHEISLNKSGNTNYYTFDKIDPESNSVIYYRLEEEDFNGMKKIVGSLAINVKQPKKMIIKTNETVIFISAPVAIKSIEIFSLDGKSLFYLEGDNELLFQINLEDIAKGLYILSIKDVNDKVTIKKVIH